MKPNIHNKPVGELRITPTGIKNQVKIDITMPIWSRVGEDGKIYIRLPLLVDSETVASSQEDAEIAIDETIKVFFLAAQRNGKGIREELERMGWKQKGQSRNNFRVKQNSLNKFRPIMGEDGEITQTHSKFSVQVEQPMGVAA